MRFSVDTDELKRVSKERMGNTKPMPLVVGVVLVALGMLLDLLVRNLSGYTALMDRLMTSAVFGSEAAQLDWPQVGAVSIVLAVLVYTMKIVLEAGFSGYLLRVYRREKSGVRNLMDGYSFFFKVLIIWLVRTVLEVLGFLALAVPGIIVRCTYSMSLYILFDHPEYGPFRCLRESRRMMKGAKGELFALGLSMIIWYLLEGIMAPVRAWTGPYTGLAVVGFYQERCRYLGISVPEIQPEKRPDEPDKR